MGPQPVNPKGIRLVTHWRSPNFTYVEFMKRDDKAYVNSVLKLCIKAHYQGTKVAYYGYGAI